MNRLIREAQSVCFSKKMILNYPSLKAQDNRINLNYYHPELACGGNNESNSNINNLGDILSKVVVEYMLKAKNLSLETYVSDTKHLYAIGSIMLMGYQNTTIWGTGFPFEPTFLRSLFHRAIFRNLDIKCVRGPYTKNTLQRLGFTCPEKFGDPAVLMPLIYTPKSEKKLDYVVIPHFSTEENLKKIIPEEHIVSMNTTDYKKVIEKISSAKKVISSSLHGIILAEVYGVPAVYFQDRPVRFNYKYSDWYASTGRTNYKIADDIGTALEYEDFTIPDLTYMQQVLCETFPYEMWEI